MKHNPEKEKLMEEVLGKRRSQPDVSKEALDVLKTSYQELQNIINENNAKIEKMAKDANLDEVDLASLKSEIEKDFNVKIETPQNIVYGKASKEVFDTIEKELKDRIVGQDRALEALIIAFRRPYVSGADPQKIRNSIILSGSNGSGKHRALRTLAELLHEHQLTVSHEIMTLDMSRYQSGDQESLFLQDLYVALQNKAPIIVVENSANGNPIFNRMLAELTINGQLKLNKRYVFANNQLQEVTGRLTGQTIDTLSGNNKTLVYLTSEKPSKLLDYYGKSFMDAINDTIKTDLYADEEVQAIINEMQDELIKKAQDQLEIKLTVDPSFTMALKERYEPHEGIDSLTPLFDKTYDRLVDLALKDEQLHTLQLYYDLSFKARKDEETYDLNFEDDEDDERKAIQEELDEIVGLQDIKNYLLSLENHLKVSKLRKQKGLKTAEVSKHMIFTGNPGTGKTTIARLISRMMKAAGILKQGQLVEVTRGDLVGKYVGHTAPLTMEVIQSALGGVLFIDEAYSLYRGKDDAFGLEAIDTLVKAMEDYRDELIVILAGYSKEMEEFLTANSGLRSRFANIIHFPDYTGEELTAISQSIAKSKDYKINETALKPLTDYFTKIQARTDRISGNGRTARNLVEAAILNQAKRLLDHPDAAIDELLLEDFDLSKEDY